MAANTSWPFKADVVKLDGKLTEGAPLTVEVPCALPGWDTLRTVRLTVEPSAPLTVTVSG